MAGKKRKLPKDLKDASAMAVCYLNATKEISDACQVLRSLNIQDVHTMDLSPDDAVLFLVAQYGIQNVSKVCSALSTLPEALPLSQKERMIQSVTEILGMMLVLSPISSASIHQAFPAHCFTVILPLC